MNNDQKKCSMYLLVQWRSVGLHSHLHSFYDMTPRSLQIQSFTSFFNHVDNKWGVYKFLEKKNENVGKCFHMLWHSLFKFVYIVSSDIFNYEKPISSCTY